MLFEEMNQLFINKGRTLGSVESFTGGKFAAAVTSISGASHFFKGSLITYATDEKVRILGMDYDFIDQYGVVSQETAAQMASRGRMLLGVDYCVSFTGNAGPNTMEGKPVGEFYIGIAVYDHVYTFKFNESGTRAEIQQKGLDLACTMLKEFLLEKEK